MYRLFFALLLAALGGSLIIHFLKNYLLKEKKRWRIDPLGMLERSSIAAILIFVPHLWIIIPAIILLRLIFELYLLGAFSAIDHHGEPGISCQEVLYKSEFGFNLAASPLFAVIIGVIFQ